MPPKRTTSAKLTKNQISWNLGCLGWIVLVGLLGSISSYLSNKDTSMLITMVVLGVILGILVLSITLNPEMKAKKALQKGRLEEALGHYDKGKKYQELANCLKTTLPKSKLSSALCEAANELGELKQTLASLKSKTQYADVIFNFESDVANASNLLWRIADRTALLKPPDFKVAEEEAGLRLPFFSKPEEERSALGLLINKQTQKIKKLVQSAHQSRESLMVILISPVSTGADLITLQSRLQTLNESIQELHATSGFEMVRV